MRYNLQLLLNFCEEHHIILRKNYNNETVNQTTIIIAKCINCDDNMKEKPFYNLIKHKNFGCKKCFTQIKKQRKIQTNLTKYGCEQSLQNKEVQEKIKNTNLNK